MAHPERVFALALELAIAFTLAFALPFACARAFKFA